MMKLSLIIQAIDKATAPIKRITQSSKGLASQGLKSVSREGSVTDRALKRISATARALPGRLRMMTVSAARLAGRAGLGALRVGANLATRALAGTIRMAGRLAAVGVGVAAAGAGMFVGGVIGMASKFEQFQVILENTEGSAEKARNAMDWVRKFAARTPFEVAQVMEAFVRLRAYGIDPTDGTLESLGNAASGMGKDVMAAVEMIADAQTGEFERLKEFGVRAKVQGDKVTFSYMRNGKDMKAIARNTAGEIQRSLKSIFDARFGGMMDRQSRTLAGMWSNIKDQIAGFQLDTGNAGVFDFVKGKIAELLAWINRLSENGTLERWAKSLSKWLEEAGAKAIEFIQNTDWQQVASDIKTVASAAWTLVSALARIVGLVAKLRAMAPRWSLGFVPGMPTGMTFANELEDAANAPPPGPRKPQSPMRAGRIPMMQPGPPIKWPAGRGIGGSRGPLKVGGAIDVRIKTDPGTTAKVTRMSSNNRDVPINVKRGPVLVG